MKNSSFDASFQFSFQCLDSNMKPTDRFRGNNRVQESLMRERIFRKKKVEM